MNLTMKKKSWFVTSLVLVIGIGMGILIATRFDFTSSTNASNSNYTESNVSYASALDVEKATMEVAQKIGETVVSISTEKIEKLGASGPHIRRYQFGFPFGGNENQFGEDPFERFFEDFFGGFPQQEYKERGLGSGVIISDDGFILTNEHVVGDADKLSVTLADGREFTAEIKGTDPRSDLAVIKIDAKNLPFAGLGDSDAVKLGQWVLAVGNPFGYILDDPEPTVTLGVVSALHRSLGRGLGRNRDYSDLIQTDAAINPGNSGGPLVNLSGQIIGINVAIFSTSGGYQGMGFAIPSNNAKRIISRLIEGKKILYGWLGVNIQDIDDNLMDYFGLKTKEGALVAKIMQNTPAEKAGLKEGDIIITFNDTPVKNTNELMKAVANAAVGKKAKVDLIRDKQKMSVQVEIGQRPDQIDEENTMLGQRDEQAEAGTWRGLSVKSLTENITRRYRIQESKGVIVVDVKPGSPADKGGITPGDVIVAINRTPIANIDDYNAITSKLKGDALVKTSRGYFVIKEQ